MAKAQKWPAESVEMRPVSGLVPYARNARTHSDEQVSQLAASIREWGWTVPVLVDENGMIIAGHGRIMAAQRLGLDKVPVMVAAGWSDAKKRAYVLADNKLAMNAGWDNDLLKIELGDIETESFALELIGFDGDELSALLSSGDVDIAPETSDEASPGVTQNYMKFAGQSVPLTDEELERLQSLFGKYTQESGLVYGFAAWLCDGRDHAA